MSTTVTTTPLNFRQVRPARPFSVMVEDEYQWSPATDCQVQYERRVSFSQRFYADEGDAELLTEVTRKADVAIQRAIYDNIRDLVMELRDQVMEMTFSGVPTEMVQDTAFTISQLTDIVNGTVPDRRGR